MELIGRKIKGFKFDGDYIDGMDSYIGRIGLITDFISMNGHYKVDFFDYNDSWYYPAELIEDHLIDDEIKINNEQDLKWLNFFELMINKESEISLSVDSLKSVLLSNINKIKESL